MQSKLKVKSPEHEASSRSRRHCYQVANNGEDDMNDENKTTTKKNKPRGIERTAREHPELMLGLEPCASKEGVRGFPYDRKTEMDDLLDDALKLD